MSIYKFYILQDVGHIYFSFFGKIIGEEYNVDLLSSVLRINLLKPHPIIRTIRKPIIHANFTKQSLSKKRHLYTHAIMS